MESYWIAYCQARSLILRGELGRAEGVLREALRDRMDYEIARLWELLGIVAHSNQGMATAQNALETANTWVPLTLHGQFALAGCYLSSGHPESARVMYLHLAGRSDLPADLLEGVASGLGRLGENELALAVCREAASRSPDSPEAFMGMAYYMRRLRRPAEQIVSVLFRAHQLDPDDNDCRIQLAWLLHECGRSDDGAYLIESLPLEALRCIRCLTLMQTIFEAATEYELATMCRLRLDMIASERSTYES